MSRIVWQENSVVSIKVRDDLYVLAQMLMSPYLVFYHCFNQDDNWKNVDLEESPILFFRGVTRQFLKHSEMMKRKDVAPRVKLNPPTRWLQSGPGSQLRKIWEGTSEEMDVMTLGEEGVRVIEKDITARGFHQPTIVTAYLKGPSHKEIDLYELAALGVFPETIERLYLCHLFDKNVDPGKDLICGKPLPKEYAVYYDAISK